MTRTGKLMTQFHDVPEGEEGEHLWLAGATTASLELGCEMQFCMAWAHHILGSVEWPSVTNARASGDGGARVEDLVFSSVLSGLVGLGWSKDNLHTAGTNSYVATQQTMLAALSLGPVGISDRLSGPPNATGVDITSNKSLVMATCAEDGTLLQPSYPLTPVDRMMHGAPAGAFASCGPVISSAAKGTWGWQCPSNLWATYTAVPVSPGMPAFPRRTAVWYTAIAFSTGHLDEQATVFESDFASLVDFENGTCASRSNHAILLSDVPCGSFAGGGGAFEGGSAGAGGHVSWSSDTTLFLAGGSKRSGAPKANLDADCGAQITVREWTGSANVTMPAANRMQGFTQLNVAPYFQTEASAPKVALLGELSKLSAVSTHRFSSMVVRSPGEHHSEQQARGVGGATLTIGLRGKPGEAVTVLFAVSSSGAHASAASGSSSVVVGVEGAFKCVSKVATIAADGTATVASPQ